MGIFSPRFRGRLPCYSISHMPNPDLFMPNPDLFMRSTGTKCWQVGLRRNLEGWIWKMYLSPALLSLMQGHTGCSLRGNTTVNQARFTQSFHCLGNLVHKNNPLEVTQNQIVVIMRNERWSQNPFNWAWMVPLPFLPTFFQPGLAAMRSVSFQDMEVLES